MFNYNDTLHLPAHGLDAIASVIRANAEFAAGAFDDETILEIAQEWVDAGFDDPDEVTEWIETARCFRADAARALYNEGVTPEEASKVADTETIGYLYANGDIGLDEAVQASKTP